MCSKKGLIFSPSLSSVGRHGLEVRDLVYPSSFISIFYKATLPLLAMLD